MKWFLIGAMLLLITGCATTPPAEKEVTRVYLDEHNVLHYEGDLDKEANQILYALYSKASVKPKLIVITSFGGDVNLGMELGYFVFNNQLDIEVSKYCMSSCANYIFTAAQNKFLNKDSALVWHGGSLQAPINEIKSEPQNIQDQYRRWQVLEQAFFKHIKVNPLVCTYGSRLQLEWGEWFANFFDPVIGFDYSLQDIQKFGIHNVKLIDNHWDWRKYQPQINVMRLAVDSNKLSYQFSDF